jgi:hypothetical protein
MFGSVKLVYLLLALASAAPPTYFSQSYIGNVNNGRNLMAIEFLPNGYQLFMDRSGYIAIGNAYAQNIPRSKYMDLSPVTLSDQYGFAEIGLWDVALDPSFTTNGNYARIAMVFCRNTISMLKGCTSILFSLTSRPCY